MSQVKYERIGPVEAQQILDGARNEQGTFDNRRISPPTVSKYARAMSTPGKYDPNIPRLAFDPEGKLVGGYHTLHAIVESGTTWDFHVLYEVTNASDLNEQRAGKAAEEIQLRGWANSRTVAAITNALLKADRGQYTFGGGDRNYSAAEVAERAAQEPLMARAATLSAEVWSTLRANRTATGFVFIKFHEHLGSEETESFFEDLISGDNLGMGDPVKGLREYWFRNHVEKKKHYGEGNRYLYGYLQAGRDVHLGKTRRRPLIPANVTAESLKKLVWWEK